MLRIVALCLALALSLLVHAPAQAESTRQTCTWAVPYGTTMGLVFLTTTDGHLQVGSYAKGRDDGTLHWQDVGSPGDGGAAGEPCAALGNDGLGRRVLHVFVRTANGKLGVLSASWPSPGPLDPPSYQWDLHSPPTPHKITGDISTLIDAPGTADAQLVRAFATSSTGDLLSFSRSDADADFGFRVHEAPTGVALRHSPVALGLDQAYVVGNDGLLHRSRRVAGALWIWQTLPGLAAVEATPPLSALRHSADSEPGTVAFIGSDQRPYLRSWFGTYTDLTAVPAPTAPSAQGARWPTLLEHPNPLPSSPWHRKLVWASRCRTTSEPLVIAPSSSFHCIEEAVQHGQAWTRQRYPLPAEERIARRPAAIVLAGPADGAIEFLLVQTPSGKVWERRWPPTADGPAWIDRGAP